MFKNEDRKAKEKLLGIFIKNFKSAYDKTKKSLRGAALGLSPPAIGLWLTGVQRDTSIPLSEIHPREREEKKAEIFGYALGVCLSVVENGLTNGRIFIMSEKEMGKILEKFERIAMNLLRLGANLRVTFIRNRIQNIAQNKNLDLNEEQRVLISRIASYFA